MSQKSFSLVLFGLMLCGTVLAAEWQAFSADSGPTDVRAITPHPTDAQILYAASSDRLYQTLDGGDSWKSVLSVRGEKEIRCVRVSPLDGEDVFVAHTKGALRSRDGGKRWARFYDGFGKSAAVNEIFIQKSDGNRIWLCTDSGLVMYEEDQKRFSQVKDLSKTAVYSIAASGGQLWAATSRGIVGSPDGVHWDLKQPLLRRESDDLPLEQFSVEEMSLLPALSNVASFANGECYVASAQGLWRYSPKENGWQLRDAAFSDTSKKWLAATPASLYLGSEKGLFKWNEEAGRLEEMSEGLLSKEVRHLVYNATEDSLIVGTKKGVYRLAHPDWSAVVGVEAAETVTAREILDRFKHEPSIRDVQAWAIRYAEVHPEKINAWRAAAARKALVPTLSLDRDLSENQNVDLDRGGTGDPDRFIIGPPEKSVDWSLGISWDLSELIWNGDQTSIDTRSKLMVELRDDILNEVNHLYFERRRLQAEMALAPKRDLPIQVEKELRLEELTAGLDALTGTAFSKALQNAAPDMKGREYEPIRQ